MSATYYEHFHLKGPNGDITTVHFPSFPEVGKTIVIDNSDIDAGPKPVLLDTTDKTQGQYPVKILENIGTIMANGEFWAAYTYEPVSGA